MLFLNNSSSIGGSLLINTSCSTSSSANLPIRARPWPRFSSNLQHNNNYSFNCRTTMSQSQKRASPIFTYLQQQEQEQDENSSSPSSTTATITTDNGWTEFSEKVSGEWDGFGADFTAEGEPIELPESVVPEAYREWEVRVFDWQTQCPTLALPSSPSSLVYKTIHLLPTVGCEADAATRYTIHERDIKDSTFFAYQSSGCYVSLWPPPIVVSNQNTKIMELEHCLIDPRDKESRVRIIQVLDFSDQLKMKLKSIKVFVERWYGPFRNGDQLGGCSIRDSAFATTQPLEASKVAGGTVWQGRSHVVLASSFHRTSSSSSQNNNMIQQLGVDECIRKSIRDEAHLILLPRQLWCSVNRSDNEETCCEVGWLLDKGQAITSKCTFSITGELMEIAMANETATLV